MIATLGALLLGTNLMAASLEDDPIAEFQAEIGQRGALCGSLKTPCGSFTFETQRKPKSRFELKKGRIRDVLAGLLRKNPSHEWQVKDGVINILPKANLIGLDRGKSPLNRTIADLEISSMTTDQAAQRILQESGLPSVGRAHMGPPEEYGKVSLHFKKVTLLEALNQLVKTDGMAAWALEYTKDKKYVVDIHSWRRRSGRVGPR
ncbi:MAG: hypothetical protein HY925_00960 [Elusimicrobia bacterium]|nr:hypothetical protein [Elusimicrobiota bacterium]